MNPHDLGTRRRVGYMSQAFSLYSEITVRQNLELHAKLFSVSPEDIPARVDEMVERFGLVDVIDSLPASLPLGIRQRLSLAVAMVHKPELLILDEPTSALDASIQAEVLNLLERLRAERGLTYVLVSHDLAVVAHMCERLMVMQHGRTVEELTRDALRRHEARESYTRTLLAASEGYTPLAAPAS